MDLLHFFHNPWILIPLLIAGGWLVSRVLRQRNADPFWWDKRGRS
jgi:hypothetical protein